MDEKNKISETIKKVSEKNISEKNDGSKLSDDIKKTLATWMIISIVASAVLGGSFGFLAGGLSAKESNSKQKEQAIQSADEINLTQEDSSVIKAVENNSPAVVSIIISKDVPKLDSYFIDPFLNDQFFNPFGYQQQQGQQQQPETEKVEIGGGTGFIVDSEGYIVTNNHVVDDEEAEYTVMMNDGSKLDAKVLAKDSYSDVAVLKVDQKNLPTVKMGDSDSLKIGQTVIAIGNSLGEFRNTVSKGIVSGLKRNVDAGDGMGKTEVLEEVIQTDAAINPGNSGGPLLNLNGEVIGVNVAMAQGAENIAFSIPANEVNKIYQSVKTTGKISQPYIGVRYMLLNDELSKQNNLSVNYGALILRGQKAGDLAVIPGSPADKVGLVENDIILEINGVKIDQNNDLAKIIRKHKVGDVLQLKVLSKGKEKTVSLTLEEFSR